MANSDILQYDDDSIPSDFFDDFSNQDFMAGLDVVDAWDDDEKSPHEGTEHDGSHPNGKKIDAIYRNTRHANRRKRNKQSRSQANRNTNENESNMKRDPKKTKRDILKDKDNWAKNNNAKMMSEKLKVVETGLVPPGTEMEVDENLVNVPMNDPDSHENISHKGSHSSTFDLASRLNRHSDSGQIRNRKRSRSLSRTRVHLDRRSPRRRRSKSFRKSFSPRRYSISPWRRSFEYRDSYRDIPPDRYLRRRSRTRSPQVSPRELWMRNRNYWHNRSGSPSVMIDRQNNAPRGFLEELADKLKYDENQKKILHEIGHRLNEPSQPHPQNMYHPGPIMQMNTGPQPLMGPVSGPIMATGSGPTGGPQRGVDLRPPASFVPPNHFFQPPAIVDPAPQYDQSFFIGQPEVFHNSNSVFNPMEPAGNAPIPGAMPQPVEAPKTATRNLTILSQETVLQKDEEKKAANKLLEEKTISLSDYLSMTAKYNDSSRPINIHKKVKVLALCQDAMKALGNTSKLNGRFFYTKNSKDTDTQLSVKCLSPLRKIPVTRFSFTTPWKGNDDKAPTQSPLHKLMASLGLSFKTAEADIDLVPTAQSKESDPVYVSPIVQPIQKPLNVAVRFQNKTTQTDIIKCDTCETRKAIKYKQKGTQFNINTLDTSTQITEEDMHRMGIKSSVVGDPKKSLAFLTPAQLLGKEEPQHRRDLYTPIRPLIPPEKLPLRFGANIEVAPKVPSLLSDELMLSMKPLAPTIAGKRAFVEQPSNMSGFDRIPEFRERTANFNQQRMVTEENFRLQQRQLEEERLHLQRRFEPAERNRNTGPPFFEPPEHRSNYYSQGFGPNFYD